MSKHSFLIRGLFGALLCAWIAGADLIADDTPAQLPLFTTTAAPPVMMINMSNDHQLYFKAYDDFSDLTGDGEPDTTYRHSFDYYGYFDSYKCYTYSTTSNRFVPQSVTADKYCDGQWSGNFLNWATMTRMDVVRKILYGGLRSTDTQNLTVLERAYLPTDAHSFAKYYNGSDINQLTPFNVTTGQNQQNSGITICNTTDGANSGNNRWSQTNTNPPLMKVARGNFALWATNERFQCLWQEDTGWNSGRINFNEPSLTGILASHTSPRRSDHGLGSQNYNARVEVCSNDLELRAGDSCRQYSDQGETSYKPIGLLQEYGESGELYFGLMTGSYARNKSGGVLRRNVGNISNEIDALGRIVQLNDSVIHTLDRLRISRYDHNEGTYTASGHDNCGFDIASFTDGRCSNWGNPQAEIYLESLRYLAGRVSPTAVFLADDASHIPARGGNLALESVSWLAPEERAPVCSPLNILQFNASTISYDGDQLTNDLNIDAAAWTNLIGQDEGIHGESYIIGRTAQSNASLRVCTAKPILALADIDGLCPESPRLEGTYSIAGLARFARQQGVPGGLEGTLRPVRTFGVALAPGVPGVEIPTISGSHNVTLLPACLNTRRTDMVQNCAIVDFKIVELDLRSNPRTGRLYVNWEISEQGGDFDSDMWGMIDFEMTATELRVTTNVIADSVGAPMGFGYTVSGTTEDGFYTPSGINNHPGNNWQGFGCTNCNQANAPVTRVFTLASSSSELLPPPLFYAAKWGGYTHLNSQSQPQGYKDAYFSVTNPSVLESALQRVFEQAASGRGTAASLSSDGPGLVEGRRVFQTRFYTDNWSGDLLAFGVDASGVDPQPIWWASEGLPAPEDRNIFTRVNGEGVEFAVGSVSAADLAVSSSEVNELIAYLRGSSVNEGPDGYRVRQHLQRLGHNPIGSIVHSEPLFVAARADFGHSRSDGLTADERSSYNAFRQGRFNQPDVVYVGANDGKLHAFNAETGEELFAYIPSALLPRLKNLAQQDYDRNHEYFLDGKLTVNDVYFDDQWYRVLVGTLGAGGQTVFALDISDPANFSADDILWEVSAPSLTGLGYVLGRPQIVRLATGEWSVVLGNGYAAATGDARLLFLHPETGALQRSIGVVPASENNAINGLSAPFVVDLNGDGVADRAYAGDLAGHLWRFNLTSSTVSDWSSVAVYSPGDLPLLNQDPDSARDQAITTRPAVTRHPQGGLAIHFGTGRYFSSSDAVAGVAIETQRYMTLRDDDFATLSGFVEQEMATVTVDGVRYRSLTAKSVPDDQRGCYFNLPDPGERIIHTPIIREGVALVSTMIPSDDICAVGAEGFNLSFDPYTCGRIDYIVYGDAEVDDPDGNGQVPSSGMESRVGMPTGSITQGVVTLHAGIEEGEDGTFIDDSGRLRIPGFNDPGFRLWHRCGLGEDEC